ncbi:MAG: DNA-directed DNA polymerase gamma mip1 [Gomphillus americanus]|uniref:DNA-directed DNA polymerase n=1 Tax=Gomphillus americanus TaxID=1940652 RepID=A0A8H3FRI9_9LECA|nr:MAG: DNA-directed DNA polymerase gamma mip1 [Gomphillus americanus]
MRRALKAYSRQHGLIYPYRNHLPRAAPNLTVYYSTIEGRDGVVRHPTSTTPVTARYNEVGVQQLSSHIYPQIFTGSPRQSSPELVALSQDHLSRHGLLGKSQDASSPISLDLPALQGTSLDEHFYRLGRACSEPYLGLAHQYAAADLPTQPQEWVRKSGWTKYYEDGRSEPIDVPTEDMLTFDVEVMWKRSPYAVMACAASPTAWYAWLSPWLLGETEQEEQFVPLGNPNNPRIVVGHNVGYDRARVLEEYNIKQSKNFFLDTMSLHVAVNGMCSRQRPTWMKHMKDKNMRERIANETNSHELASLLENNLISKEEAELWIDRSSINSLRDVAMFHCNVEISKAQRDNFSETQRDVIYSKLDELLDYCASDVAITQKIFKKVFPAFIEVCPHPVSFGALRHLSSVILPVDRSWEKYIERAETTYKKLTNDVEQRLFSLAEKALEHKQDPDTYENDPWLCQLDWTIQEIRMVKGKKKGDPPRPAARQKLPGLPLWYRDLFPTSTSPISLTVRTRIAPLLLRLSWDERPLVWSDTYGWTFRVKSHEQDIYKDSPAILCDMSNEKNLKLRTDLDHVYFKLPHKDGPTARCVTPLAKGYLQYFEKGTLSSEYPTAKEALEMNASCSYWISARDRIMSQMVVYRNEHSVHESPDSKQETGFILPQIIPMGTITRRAVENTWLTASNAKKNRVGSELKSMITAPPGYCFVGADVDSQELWIASLLGDAQFKIHGGNAVGFMTLEGTKAAGTDLHSKTAKILGISRNDAKVFNYGRIYGAGLKFAATLLRQFNPSLNERQTVETAAKLYKATKGTKTSRKAISSESFWRGGTESLVFNTLEAFANQEHPRTPVLGAGITEALMRRYINKGAFMTSRINWAIQSSGVDYLHLLIISMDYLIAQYNLNARLAITVHDEIRYLVAHEHRYKAAMALQVANLWTRAMFSQQIGIDDLPQSCAFFSGVDIDHVLRKEVNMDCITPSHPEKIPHGESLDIEQLIAKGQEAALDGLTPPVHPYDVQRWDYQARKSVMAQMHGSSLAATDLAYLKAQIVSEDKELREISNQTPGSTLSPKPPRSRKASTKGKSTSSEDKIFKKALKPLSSTKVAGTTSDDGTSAADYAAIFQRDGWKSYRLDR